MLTEGNLVLKNNLFNLIADDTEANALTVKEEKGTAPVSTAADLLAHFNDNNNAIANLATVGFIDDEYLLIPASGEANAGIAPTDSWFDNVTYQGAFQPGGSNWTEGWTLTFSSSK